MQWSDIQFHPSLKTLRQFAGLCLVFFGGLAAWQGIVSGRGTLALALAALALMIGLLGLLWPRMIRPVYVGWMILAFPIGWTVSQAMLAVMFYGLFTPIGLLFRLIGRDPLHRARRADLETYWSPKPSADDPRRYFKQF
jgi:Saxitoxin biosynthesis operon protein SxtJ